MTNSGDPRVWLVTGASSGFGRAIAQAALARGDSVAAGVRTTEAFGGLPDGVQPLALDVTVPDQREAATASVLTARPNSRSRGLPRPCATRSLGSAS